jgi:hypothetical protein
MCAVEEDEDAPAELAARMILNSAVLEALSELNEREQQVVRLRFGLEDSQARTLEELGKEFGVTRERIRQIESKTLAKLRHPDRSHNLPDDLDGEGDDDGATGVREPRRPIRPSLGPGHALEQPREFEASDPQVPLPPERLRPTGSAVRGSAPQNGAAA